MITEAGPLNLKAGATGMTCKVHPTVLVTICDSFVRRPAGAERVIGTLLGNEGPDSIIVVKACYAVPHEETDDQVQLDVPHHTMMLELHQRVHPKHTVVGWFSTGVSMSARDALIHHFYSKGKSSGCGTRVAMSLQTDTELTQDNRLGYKAHVYRKLMLGGQELAAEFVEVATSVPTAGPEGLALDALREEKIDAIPGDSENFRKSFATLQELIGQAHAYVTDVVEGRREADVTIGRYLSDIIGQVPCHDKAEFKKLFEDCTQDILLVMYLSNLVRSHVALAEKLGTFALALA